MALRRLRLPALALLLMLLVSLGNDALHLDPAQEVAYRHAFNLVDWELGNFLGKWTHRLSTLLSGDAGNEARLRKVREYFQLGQEIGQLQAQLEDAGPVGSGGHSAHATTLEAELAHAIARREALRGDTEEALEAAISAILAEGGLSAWGEFVFPPVDFRLSELPRLLVTSPRDRIQRLYDVLLDPDITVEDSEDMEDRLVREYNLSAVVLDIGGVATYPATIPNDQPLRWTLDTAAHEWLHNYLFFRPLGQNMFSSSEMVTLNETLADIAGREIGGLAYALLTGAPPAGQPPEEEARPPEGGGFSFAREMRQTRLRVDELLAQGRIEEAEAYMEAQRQLFWEHGYHIRKLNQAYFAFHGTYAESPTSASPIGDQLHQFRALSPDLGTFVKTVASFSSYQDFLEALESRKAEAAAREAGALS